jgi:hypothetical protein
MNATELFVEDGGQPAHVPVVALRQIAVAVLIRQGSWESFAFDA